MPEEKLEGAAEGDNNPGDSGAAAGAAEAGHEGDAAAAAAAAGGATPPAGAEGGEKKEFEDPNMQAAFTKRMQELSEEREALKAEKEAFDKDRETTQKRLELLQRIDSDPEIVSFVRKKWGVGEQAAEKPAFTHEELVEAQSDPAKMAQLIAKEVDARVKKVVEPISQRVSNAEFTREINDYADSEGNEDFFDLHKQGLIKPLIQDLRAQNPRASGIELIKAAHAKAREISSSIGERTRKEEKERMAREIAEKKGATTDKGGRASAPVASDFKGKSILEIGLNLEKNY